MIDRKLLSAGCVVLLAGMLAKPPAVRADEKKVLEVGKWYPTLQAGLNLTQSYFSANWSGGGNGSVVWALIADAALENQIDPKVDWLNTLRLAFGQTHAQSVDAQGSRRWDSPDKSTDQISFETIARFTLGGFVDPFVAGDFESQFEDRSDPNGRSLAFDPLQFKESAGIARNFYKTDRGELMSRVGFAFRQNSRRSFAEDTGSATVTANTNDGGIEWVTEYRMNVLGDRLSWSAKLTANKPLFYSGQDQIDAVSRDSLAAAGIDPHVADFTKTVDASFENVFTNQISKVLSVNLFTRWVYDKYDNSVVPTLRPDGGLANPEKVRAAVRKSGQFKQSLSVGVTYRFL